MDRQAQSHLRQDRQETGSIVEVPYSCQNVLPKGSQISHAPPRHKVLSMDENVTKSLGKWIWRSAVQMKLSISDTFSLM